MRAALAATGRVVRAEAFRLLRKRRVYVLAGLWWVGLPVAVLVLARVLQVTLTGSFVEGEAVPVKTLLQGLASPFGVARVGLVAPAYLSPSPYVIAVALLAAAGLGEPRTHRMWKSTLVSEPDRRAVLAGTFLTMQAFLGVLLAGAFVFGAAFGALGTTFLPTAAEGAWGRLALSYLLQWAHLAALLAFASLAIFVLRNVTLGVVTTFFLPPLLEGLYAVWRATAGFEPLNRVNALFQTLQLQATLEALPRWFLSTNLYLPARTSAAPLLDEVIGNLQALGEEAGGGPGGAQIASLLGADLTLPHAGLVMAVYFAAFATALTIAFLRRDVA